MPRLRSIASFLLAASVFTLSYSSCVTPQNKAGDEKVDTGAKLRAVYKTALVELNEGACETGQKYVQPELMEPVLVAPQDGRIDTELVVRIRERCVPVWDPAQQQWTMQTLNLRTYGFPKEPGIHITPEDADDPNSPKIAWSAPGPTFVMYPASKPGASDGTRFSMRLYNRMPADGDPTACEENLKCNTKGENAGVDPKTGQCKVPPDPKYGGFSAQTPSQTVNGQVIEPPNCFHGQNSTNFHFHGFHVSPQLGQDFVGLEIRPPGQRETHGSTHGAHGEHGTVVYGHFDYALDPLRYTQAPGTHWYHAHKHGSTALHVLNGQVGTFKIKGEFDEALEKFFQSSEGGGAELVDRLMVVQQLQEKQPGLGGVDQSGAVLVNGLANPIVKMAKGEIQRWRFVGATMQATAALRVGFPDLPGMKSPVVRQIAMDGVQFSPENYTCQPFLNNPDCSPKPDDSSFNELTAFNLSPGNRVDVLVQAPSEAGKYCMVLDVTTKLNEKAHQKIRTVLAQQAANAAGTCGIDPNSKLGPLFTLVVEDSDKPMNFPTEAQFPKMASYLKDLPKDPAVKKDIHYQMVDQTSLTGTQFWINQEKYNPNCMNESLTLDVPEQWTLWNNSKGISHPFHIHQNPFQLISESDRGVYKYPVWRDTLPIPIVTGTPPESCGTSPFALAPNSDPKACGWGNAVLVYVAKEFTGAFVNHCHILGHEDRGMMHNTQSVCADGQWAETSAVKPGAVCDKDGFCPSDCATGTRIPAGAVCPAPPPQTSDWPKAYGVTTK